MPQSVAGLAMGRVVEAVTALVMLKGPGVEQRRAGTEAASLRGSSQGTSPGAEPESFPCVGRATGLGAEWATAPGMEAGMGRG